MNNLKKLQRNSQLHGPHISGPHRNFAAPKCGLTLQRTKYLFPLPGSNLYSSAIQPIPYTDWNKTFFSVEGTPTLP